MSTPLQDQWTTAQGLVRSQVQSLSYETWIKPLAPVKFENETLYLRVPSILHRNFISANSYLSLIQNAFSQVIERLCEVVLLMEDEIDALEKNGAPADFASSEPVMLNPKYTFDAFVVGSSNRFAHAACLAVAEAPAKAYNPLFLYGGVGLGKTHLMQAIGHFVRHQSKDLNILYVTSEKFTNQLIAAIGNNTMDNFRRRYRYVDVLLIDDIQFIAGKERTQEEFFHTFNSLYEAQKQIIVSSDRPPRDMELLEERLKSRFEWGLIADIQAPDLETRIAILKKKADNENMVNIDSQVLELIATKSENNIRELEGALTRVIAYSRLTKQDINMELAQEALKDIIRNTSKKKATPDTIMDIVCSRFGISKDALLGRKRNRDVAYPRQICMYLSRELTDLSLSSIGDAFGGRDHTTVLHAHRLITGETASNNDLRLMIADMIKSLTEE